MEADLEPSRTRAPRAGPWRVRIVLAGLLLVVLALGSAYAIASSVFGVGLIDRPFDHERWTAADRHAGDRKARRARMVRNLVKRHLSLGMSREEVRRLLGPPDADPILAPRAPGDWIYELGSTPLERLRFMWWALSDDSDPESTEQFEELSEILTVRALMVGFDEAGRVDRLEIVEE